MIDLSTIIEFVRYEGSMGFIMQSWLNSYVSTGAGFMIKGMGKQDAMRCHTIVVNEIMKRSTVWIARPIDGGDCILAYLIVEKRDDQNIFHYAYARPAQRRLRVISKLISEHLHPKKNTTTHRTPSGLYIQRKFDIKYNPYLLWRLDDGNSSNQTSKCDPSRQLSTC